jgi:murein DD-endopeptidase MepM/ murein hydrolase activator NlpD
MRIPHRLLLAIVLAATGAAPPWTWPVGPPATVVDGWRAPASRYAAGHRGIDVAARTGSPVVAPADAIVRFAGVVVDRPVVTLMIDDDLLVSIEPVESALAAGQAVSRGTVIGVVAAGGHCDGRCVHIGVRESGDYVSPLRFLGTISRAVLLPLRPAAARSRGRRSAHARGWASR